MDDVVDTAGTLIRAADALKSKGASSVVSYIISVCLVKQ